MTFNLPAPPGFRGFDPRGPVRIYHRHLPHWRQDGATYFVTFNLADAVPANKQREIRATREEWERNHPPPRDEQTWVDYARTVFRNAERVMDAGYGRCWFQQSEYAEELDRSLRHFHGKRYELGCFVIMANHGHLIMRPLEGFDLEKELGAIKRTTARFINEKERRSGSSSRPAESLWQQESYDRIIRDEEHLWRVLQYIGRNPAKAGIPPDKWRRWINPEWISCGWRFEDARQ